MTFHSVLFPSAEARPPSDALAAPDFFVDLNLDQVVTAITDGKGEYNLTPFFHWPLRDVDAVRIVMRSCAISKTSLSSAI